MTFFRIAISDIRNGIVKQWKKYIWISIFFITLSVLGYLDIQAALRMKPPALTLPVSIGDYFCYIFGGTSPVADHLQLPSNIFQDYVVFEFPSIWITAFLVLLLSTLQYPYKDLMGFGKHMMILSAKRHYWWFSKCLWCIGCVVAYFLTAILSISLSALALGAEFSLRINSYFPYLRIKSVDYILNPPWDIMPTLIMLIPVGIGICTIQLLLSLILNPTYSYLITTSFLVISSFINQSFLFPNSAMASRTTGFVSNGFNMQSGLIIIIWICSLCVLIGYLYLKRIDIINHDK